MTRFKFIGVAFLVGVLPLAACSPLTRDLRPFDRQTLTSGEWMGVTIGMDREVASQTLLKDRRFRASRSVKLRPGNRTCGDSDFIDNYRAEEFGATLHVEIYSKAGQVTCIEVWKRPFQLTG